MWVYWLTLEESQEYLDYGIPEDLPYRVLSNFRAGKDVPEEILVCTPKGEILLEVHPGDAELDIPF